MSYNEIGCQGYCQNTILDSVERKYDSKNNLISSRHVIHTYRGCADGYDPFQYDQVTEFCENYFCDIDLPVFNDDCYPTVITTTTTTTTTSTPTTAPTALPTTRSTAPITTSKPTQPPMGSKGIQIGLIVTSILSVLLIILSLITIWHHRKLKKKLVYYKTLDWSMKIANGDQHESNTTYTNLSATSST